MNEGRKKKELSLELTEPRNPYLHEEFSTRRRRPSKEDEEFRRVNSEQAGRVKYRKEQMRLLKKKKALRRRRAFMVGLILFVLIFLFFWIRGLFFNKSFEEKQLPVDNPVKQGPTVEKPDWVIDYLTTNDYSRSGEKIEKVTNIFVHYTANPGTSAAQNRSYFESLKDTHERYASAHFVIGFDGEIIQCIPFDEIAYAVQTRNYDSISIECCYLNEDGSFTDKTKESLEILLAYLLQTYELGAEDILRHYDSGGKKCPLYYVENEGEWEEFKEKVDRLLSDGL